VSFVDVLGNAGDRIPVEVESLAVRGAFSGRSDSLSRIGAPGGEGNEATYEVKLRVDPADLPSLPEGPVLDWLSLEGKLTNGQVFSSRSLVCLRPVSSAIMR